MTPRILICITSAFNCLFGEYWKKTRFVGKGYGHQEFEAMSRSVVKLRGKSKMNIKICCHLFKSDRFIRKVLLD